MSEEKPARCLDVNVVQTIADDPQRVSVAKGVNDTLNAYISITDAKAVAFLGGATAAASFFLSHKPDHELLRVFYYLSAVAYGCGAVAALTVIFPRMPVRGTGVVFWGDIASRSDPSTYAADFEQSCHGGGILEDYARLNWCTSVILRRKVKQLRLAMVLTF